MMQLEQVPGRFAVCRLDPGTPFDWRPGATLLSVTQTDREMSIVCDEGSIPAEATVEGGWKCLRVCGEIPFSTVGLLAALTSPLAAAGISVFAFSTFDTDYLMVGEAHWESAVACLVNSGFSMSD